MNWINISTVYYTSIFPFFFIQSHWALVQTLDSCLNVWTKDLSWNKMGSQMKWSLQKLTCKSTRSWHSGSPSCPNYGLPGWAVLTNHHLSQPHWRSSQDSLMGRNVAEQCLWPQYMPSQEKKTEEHPFHYICHPRFWKIKCCGHTFSELQLLRL